MEHEIIPQNLAITAMRASGYRDTAYALAELIDNSIQAGEGVNEQTAVELLCVDRVTLVSTRQTRRLHRLAVYDNASGMDAATLRMALQFGNGTRLTPDRRRGIGKFGMGLPNASISQCKRVDVWTWEKGKVLTSHLDVEEIEKKKQKEVPAPQPAELPKEWRRLIRDKVGPHGTLVVWSQLDRVKWKGSRALLDNAEFLIGRIYRHFINDGRAVIRLAAFEEDKATPEIDRDVLPNDPLYLMVRTSAPPPFHDRPAFDPYDDVTLTVKHNGVEHPVHVRYSLAKPEARSAGGSSAFGGHAVRNQGISVVRADRELEMNNSFDIRYDPRERWWGVEVAFGPELDDVFGVTNNKQAATAFHSMDLDEDAKAEGVSPGEYRERLEEAGDPRLAIYELSARLRNILDRVLRPKIKQMKEGSRTKGSPVPPAGAAELDATRAIHKRREELGIEGASDRQEEQQPEGERSSAIKKVLVEGGTPEPEAEGIAVEWARSHCKVLFQEAEVSGSVFFDVKLTGGTIIIQINTRHPASEHFYNLLQKGNEETDSPELKALKLILGAWGRLEDEAGDARKRRLEIVRADWGRLAEDFLNEAASD
jgi:hypothetical protein